MKFSELLTPDEFKKALTEQPSEETLTEVLQDLSPYRDIVGMTSTIRRKEAYDEVCMVLVSIAAALRAKDSSEKKMHPSYIVRFLNIYGTWHMWSEPLLNLAHARRVFDEVVKTQQEASPQKFWVQLREKFLAEGTVMQAKAGKW